MTTAKPGRPREYAFTPAAGIAHPDAAYLVGALDELSERLFDLIEDVPDEALHFIPENGGTSMASLALHMAVSEVAWIAPATGNEIVPDIAQALELDADLKPGEIPPTDLSADALISVIRRVRDECTKAWLSEVTDIDTTVTTLGRTASTRGALMHLVWHWTYHSGQVGLLRRLGGPRYAWTFADRVTGADG
jgi:uncharacterized damage-inducible protein DinB